MESILKQQRMTNNDLPRLEDRSNEVENTLQEIHKSMALVAHSTSSVKDLILVSVGSLEKIEDVSIDNSKQLALSNVSESKDSNMLFDMLQSGIQIMITKLEDIESALLNFSGIPMTYGAQNVTNSGEIQRESIKIEQRQVSLLEHIAESLDSNQVGPQPEVKEDSGGFLSTITKMLGAVGGLIAPLFKALPKLFGGIFDLIGKGLKGAFSAIFSPGSLLRTLGKTLGPVAIIGSLINGISDAIDAYDPEDPLSEMIPKVIKSFFGGMLEFISMGTLGQEEINEWFTSLSDWFSLNIIDPFMNFFSNIGEKLGALKTWWDEFDLVKTVSEGINDITSKISKAFKDVVEWFSELTIGGILKTLGVSPEIADTTQKVYDSVTGATQDAITTTVDAAGAVKEKVTGFFGGAFDSISNFFSGDDVESNTLKAERIEDANIKPSIKTLADVPNQMSSETMNTAQQVTIINNNNSTSNVNAPTSNVVAGRPASNNTLPNVYGSN